MPPPDPQLEQDVRKPLSRSLDVSHVLLAVAALAVTVRYLGDEMPFWHQLISSEFAVDFDQIFGAPKGRDLLVLY